MKTTKKNEAKLTEENAINLLAIAREKIKQLLERKEEKVAEA